MMMGSFIIAPAQMQARLLRGHVFQRVIQRLDLCLRRLLEARRIHAAEQDMPTHRQIGAIHLQDQAGFGDLLVFYFEHISQRPKIFFFCWIILVGLKAGDDARRCRIHEGFIRARFFFRRQQVGDVLLQRAKIFDRDGVAHDGPMINRRAASVSQALFIGGIIIQILRRRPRHIGDFETGEAMPHVGDVADLAHLAIADDIDASRHLLLRHFKHRAPHDPVEFRRIVGFVPILRKQLIDHVLRPRHAADVRRENAIPAGSHPILLRLTRRTEVLQFDAGAIVEGL